MCKQKNINSKSKSTETLLFFTHNYDKGAVTKLQVDKYKDNFFGFQKKFITAPLTCILSLIILKIKYFL